MSAAVVAAARATAAKTLEVADQLAAVRGEDAGTATARMIAASWERFAFEVETRTT